jgi:hypothetical protein
VERKSTLGTRTAREVRKRDGRIEKKADAYAFGGAKPYALRRPQRALYQETEFSKSPRIKRTNDTPGNLIETELGKSRPERHSYLAYTIFLGIKFLISGLNSLRGMF